MTKEEALSGDIIYYDRYINLGNLTSAEGLKLPKTVNGALGLFHLTSAEGLTLSETVNGPLYLGDDSVYEKLNRRYPNIKFILH